MGPYYDHMGGWGWAGMAVIWLLFLALLVLAAVLVGRAGRRAPDDRPAAGRPPAEQILAERFARGEIDEEEYHRRSTALRTDHATSR